MQESINECVLFANWWQLDVSEDKLCV